MRPYGWSIVNDTPLPVVCFTDAPAGADPADTAAYLQNIADRVVAGGRAWISATRLAGRPALRACVTNFATTEKDIATLVSELASARASM